MKIKTLIVDDEESARDVLVNLLNRFCPDVEVLATCESVEECLEAIKINEPNLIFLDIEMPNYAGFELFKLVDNVNFETVFTTAYEQYAIKAFEVSAVDYLLKPIDIDRLKSAVEKVKNQIDVRLQKDRMKVFTDTFTQRKLNNIVIIDKGCQIICPIETIIAFEAQESYCTIYTSTNRYVQSKNLKHFESLLDENKEFVRVHKSWIVNLKKLESYNKAELRIQLTGGISAKVSKYKKQEFEVLMAF